MDGSTDWTDAALDRVLRGDVSELGPAVARLRGSDPESDALALVLEANGALLGVGEPPDASAIAACAARGPTERCAEAAYLASVAHALDLEPVPPPADSTPWSELAGAWSAIASGRNEEALARARGVISSGEARRNPRLTTGATAASAVAMLAGDTTEAVAVARRAMRMAQSEGIVADEYLTGLVLARARRFAQTTEAAIRILGALARVVPARWLPAVAWEALFCGAGDVVRHATERLSDRPSRSAGVVRALAALLAGERAATHRPPAIAPLDSELGSLLAALGLAPAAGSLAAWLAGTTDEPPRELAGLCAPAVDVDGFEHAATYAVGGVFEAPRRVLGVGVGLVLGAPVELRGEPRAHVRQCATAAALLLAGGEGLDGKTLFERVYGFAYHDRHGAVFRNTITKTRTWLGERAEIVWREGRYFLVPSVSPLLLPDPRTAPPVTDVLLRAIAAAPRGIGARDLAAALSLPLRTVQAHLGELVANGACASRREGNANLYQMEDTTFGEPTFTRLTPKT